VPLPHIPYLPTVATEDISQAVTVRLTTEGAATLRTAGRLFLRTFTAGCGTAFRVRVPFLLAVPVTGLCLVVADCLLTHLFCDTGLALC